MDKCICVNGISLLHSYLEPKHFGGENDDPSLWICKPTKPRCLFTTYSFERKEPRDYDVVTDIQYSGICNWDIHQVNNEWDTSTFPMVPGQEIIGIVSKVGTKVTLQNR